MEEILEKLEQWEEEDDGRGYLPVAIDKKKNLVKTKIKMTEEHFAVAMMGIRKSLEEEIKGKGGHGQNR